MKLGSCSFFVAARGWLEQITLGSPCMAARAAALVGLVHFLVAAPGARPARENRAGLILALICAAGKLYHGARLVIFFNNAWRLELKLTGLVYFFVEELRSGKQIRHGEAGLVHFCGSSAWRLWLISVGSCFFCGSAWPAEETRSGLSFALSCSMGQLRHGKTLSWGWGCAFLVAARSFWRPYRLSEPRANCAF
jgi:hypothetical protein